jgi:hypothetical protein
VRDDDDDSLYASQPTAVNISMLSHSVQAVGQGGGDDNDDYGVDRVGIWQRLGAAFSWKRLVIGSIVMLVIALTIADALDAVVAQRIEYEQHLRVLNIQDADTIHLIAEQVEAARYFTRRSQCGMILMRVYYNSLPYRLVHALVSFVSANADAFTHGWQRVLRNVYIMGVLIVCAMALFARIIMHFYTEWITTSRLERGVDRLAAQILSGGGGAK